MTAAQIEAALIATGYKQAGMKALAAKLGLPTGGSKATLEGRILDLMVYWRNAEREIARDAAGV